MTGCEADETRSGDGALIRSDAEGHWWDGFGSASERGLDGGVGALAVYQGDLIAGGVFWTAGDLVVDRIARWDGSTWHALGGGIDPCLAGCNGTVVLALAVDDLDLIVGGSFRSVDDGKPALYVARWDGSTWHALGGGFDDQVNALLVWRGRIIAGGRFRNADGRRVDRIAQWDGTSWSPLHTGVNAEVRSLVEFQGDLVAAGAFGHAGILEVNGIARWDGSAWHALGEGTGFSMSTVVYDSTLIAGGTFDLESGLKSALGRWNGTSWEGIVAPPSWPTVLGVYNEQLFMGGGFSGGVYGNYIARWDGANWSTLGSGLNRRPWALAVVGSHLYVGGDFSTAGGSPSWGIARWDETITAIEVADIQVRTVPGAVELTWRLSTNALREVAAVDVERARATSGPFLAQSEQPLPAAPAMSFRDADAGSGTEWWYRLVLLRANGARVIFGPVRVLVPEDGALQTSLEPPEGTETSVRIRYRIGAPANVQLSAYDVRGRLLRVLDAGIRPAGEYVRHWDRLDQTGTRLPRGVYLLHLQAGPLQASRKFVLLQE